jgi:hypothetical protein
MVAKNIDRSFVRSTSSSTFFDNLPHSHLPLSLPLPSLHQPAGLIITSALMIWKSLILFTGSESPVSWSRCCFFGRKEGRSEQKNNPTLTLALFFTSFLFPLLKVVVVLSGSMEPGFHRGDILFLSSAQKGPPLNSGDIVVFNIGGRGEMKEKKSFDFFAFRVFSGEKTLTLFFQTQIPKKQTSRSSTASSRSTTAAS